MSDELENEAIETQFLTYHLSGNDLHLRTDDGVLWIEKGKDELQNFAKSLRRGDRIRAEGAYVLSKTLSSTVLQVSALARA